MRLTKCELSDFSPGGFRSKHALMAKRSFPNQRLPHLLSREFLSHRVGGPPMSRTFRRFELLLPLQFNNGQAVPDELIAQTILEMRDQFGAVSSETQTIRGNWEH